MSRSSEGDGGGPARPAVFLDRDGVLNELVLDPESHQFEAPLAVADVRVDPTAAEGIRQLRAAGYATVCVTNQPAHAKGRISLETLWSVHRAVVSALAASGGALDGEYVCLHHPDGVVPEFTRACDCRKPAPGLLRQAERDLHLDLVRSWLVGDTDTDVAAGRAAGVTTVLVLNPASAHKRSGALGADHSVATFSDAVALIVGLGHTTTAAPR